MGPNQAETGLGRSWPACSESSSRPLWPRCSSIYCLCLRWPPHPSNHQRVADTKEKYREEADGRRKSSSCLGDGLGHSLAAIVGHARWSHGGVPEPRLEFVKLFVPPTFDGDINQFLSLLWSTTSCAYSYVYLPYAFNMIRSNHGD
jgi:hypothetical protein